MLSVQRLPGYVIMRFRRSLIRFGYHPNTAPSMLLKSQNAATADELIATFGSFLLYLRHPRCAPFLPFH